MESIIVATFQNLQDAEKGMDRIRELDLINDINVYNIVLVQNTETGIEFLYRDGPDAKNFPKTGAIAGLLLGALAGPLGMVIGAMAGGISGSLDRINVEKGQQEFLNKIKRQLKTGCYALIMDVKEDNPSLINFYLEQHSAAVTRTILDDVYTNSDLEEWESLVRKNSQAEKEWELAGRDEKAAVKERIEKLKAKKEEYLKAWAEKKADGRKRPVPKSKI